MNQKLKIKRHFIKDAIWGEIEIYPWEKPLFATSLINRLHHITQNASAFRVYPCLKHTRFSHSVGVMHVAGEYCKNLIANLQLDFDSNGQLVKPPRATTANRDSKHFKSLDVEITAFDEELRVLHRNHLGSRNWYTDDGNYKKDFLLPLSRALSGNLPDRYVVGFAALRIAGLLHDVGHLPYSHTAESALKHFLAESSASNKSSNSFLIYKQLQESGLQLHEFIGLILLDNFERFSGHLPIPGITRYLVLLAKSIIFSNQFPILHSIVSGPIDADRIDYVRRDSEVSGFQKSGVDYSRLFHSITLVHFEESIDPQTQFPTGGDKQLKQQKGSSPPNNRIIATPGPRAISDIEKLLRERFQAYRHIYNHHKVRLFDLLLQRCILHLNHTGHFEWLWNNLADSISTSNQYSEEDDVDDPYPPNDEIAKESNREAIQQQREKSLFYDHIRLLELQMQDGWLEQQVAGIWHDALKLPKSERIELEDSKRWLYSIIVKTVADRTRFKTGFRSPNEFWKTLSNTLECPSTIKEASKTRNSPLFLRNLASDLRKIEIELMKKQILVLFGVQAGPESIGANPEFLKHFELHERCNDLVQLTYQSPFVNFWYHQKADQTEDSAREIRTIIIDRLKKSIDKTIKDLRKERLNYD